MLDIQLLGPPVVTVDGAPIDVDTRKAIAMVAYLAIERAVDREVLAGLFWAEIEMLIAKSAKPIKAANFFIGDSSCVAFTLSSNGGQARTTFFRRRPHRPLATGAIAFVTIKTMKCASKTMKCASER